MWLRLILMWPKWLSVVKIILYVVKMTLFGRVEFFYGLDNLYVANTTFYLVKKNFLCDDDDFLSS